MTTDPKQLDALERLATLDRARALQDMMATPGWRELMALRRSWINKGREELLAQPTADPAAATDMLRRWQLAEDLYRLEERYIEETLASAREITEGLGLDEALFMERLREQPESSGSAGYPANPTGH